MTNQRGSGGEDTSIGSVNVTVNLPKSPPLANSPQDPDREPYQSSIAYALWCVCFIGGFGIHRFYLGRIWSGIFYLLTAGGFFIGQLYDLITMKRLVRNANIQTGRLPHPRQARIDTGAAAPSPRPKLPRPADLRQQLLQAAVKNGGELTVTQGVLATAREFEEVESTLNKMADKGYVDVDNAPGTGVVVYRFPELISNA